VKISVKLVVVAEGISTRPAGPMLARGDRLPMWDHYLEHGGYYFDPKEIEQAEACAVKLSDYVKKNNQPKKKK
jgi:hypothetical protein